MKYNIGDKVWLASCSNVQKTATCPDCCGNRYLTVIMGNGDHVTIECAGCQSGYEQPKGFVYYWQYEVQVHQIIIDGIDSNPHETKYKYNSSQYSWHIAKEEDLFLDKESAENRASEMMEERNKAEREKIKTKEYNKRTWSWNAHYHARQIKEAKRLLEYHTEKLNYAKTAGKLE